MFNYTDKLQVKCDKWIIYVNKVSATTHATPIRERRALDQDEVLVLSSTITEPPVIIIIFILF
jgi:hypothetical protein